MIRISSFFVFFVVSWVWHLRPAHAGLPVASAVDSEGALAIAGKRSLEAVKKGETAGYWAAACELVKGALPTNDREQFSAAMTAAGCKRRVEIEGFLEFCEDPLTKAVPDASTYEGLKPYLRKLPQYQTDATVLKGLCETADANPESLMPASFGGALGAAWQDAVIRGIAAFVTTRLRAEVELMVQERIGDGLCANPKVEPLVSDTCKLVEQMRAGDAPLAWGTVKHAVTRDLRALPRALGNMLSNSDDPDTRALGVAIVASLQILDGIRDGRSPIPVLGALSELRDNMDDDVATRVLVVTGVVVKVLGTDLSHPVSEDEMEKYLDLVLALVCKEVACDASTLRRLVGADLRRMRAALEELAALTQAAIEASADGRKLSAERYFDVAEQTTAVLGIGAALAMKISQADTEVPPRCSAADGSGTPCILVVFEELPNFVAALAAASKGDYHDVVVSVLLVTSRLGAEVPEELAKWAPFLADLASAKDADSVEAALEGVAEPRGSYKKKRGHEAGFTASVNAFVGIHGGGEYLLPRSGGEVRKPFAGQLALFMPVGIDVTWGLGKRGSVGLFASIIDLGALSSFRLGDDNDATATATTDGADVDTEPKVGFAQVVSPGLFAMLGIPKTPLAIGVGASFSPRLRRVLIDSGTTTETRNDSTIRFGAVLTADIPIVVFHRRPRQRASSKMAKSQRVTPRSSALQSAPGTAWTAETKNAACPNRPCAAVQKAVAKVNELRGDLEFLQEVAGFDYYASRQDARKGRYYAGEDVAAMVQLGTVVSPTEVTADRTSGAASTDIGKGVVRVSTRHHGLRSCAEAGQVSPELVNTVLHEYMHLFPLQPAPSPRRYRFTDDGIARWRRYAVSYQVGNVAQCYLEAKARGVAPGRLSASVRECMDPEELERDGNLSARDEDACVPTAGVSAPSAP